MSAESNENVHVRVTRLEESVMFTDQTSEALSEEIRNIARSIEALARRLGTLETRLTEIADREQEPGLVPPPHSAGPDISRDPL